GQIIAFTPHVTNGAPVTLNVDSLGAKPLRSAPNAELPAGTIIQGTPYVAFYSNSDGAFYLHGFFGNPYNIPIGSSLEFWGSTAPNSAFAFPYGQAISRTSYSTLFAIIGTMFGAGDGTTTFNLPDLRGRVTACLDNMGGATANRLSTGSLAGVRHSLGGAGGEDAHILTLAELAAGITSAGSNAIIVQSQNGLTGIPTTTSAVNVTQSVVTNGSASFVPASTSGSWAGVNSLSGVNTINVTSNNTGGSSHNNMPPTILCNRIMRLI
ncbi:MAG: phage tail protein, partial [Bradyrhizobium sp.]